MEQRAEHNRGSRVAVGTQVMFTPLRNTSATRDVQPGCKHPVSAAHYKMRFALLPAHRVASLGKGKFQRRVARVTKKFRLNGPPRNQ